MRCEKCGGPHRGILAVVLIQIVTWIGWGAFGGGTWVLVGELLKKFVVHS